MTAITTYFFRGLSIEASIGFHERELAAAQRILIDIDYDCATPEVGVDDVGDALDYDTVRQEVVAIVGKRHFNLQETLCGEILASLLAHPEIRRARVSVRKPDIYPDINSVGVVMETKKP